jgi:tRNA (guanine-N7-)-methyltransferase
MGRQKQIRFGRLPAMPNVIDGRLTAPGWFEAAFGPETPVLLELGCGHGDALVERARHDREGRFLGVERNGARLWKGARRALDEGIDNVMFCRSTVEALDDHLPAGRVAEIWLFFPDPLPKRHQSKHRLVSPGFVDRYRRLLAPGGAVRLRTDSWPLTTFAENAVREAGGRVSEPEPPAGDGLPAVETRYERRFRAEGRPVYERLFRFD